MDLQAEIRDEVAAYLSGVRSIASLWDWAQERFWDIDNREDPEQAMLAHEVALLLSETANGDWTEDELRDALRAVVSVYRFRIGKRPDLTSSAGLGRTVIMSSPDLQPA
ncbi:MAG: hypothetical protein ACRDFW_13380 [bacterium]